MEPRPPTPSDPSTPPMAEAVPEPGETASEVGRTAVGDNVPNAIPVHVPEPQVGTVIGPYRILGSLGKGGMAVVYLAEEIQLKRQVALKVLSPATAAGDELAKARFQREAEAQAQVEHEHVAIIYAVGEAAGVSYIAMPVLKGLTLAEALRKNPKPPLAALVRIGHEIAQALVAAHAKRLIHRDIKPGNVWLEGDRCKVKVLDFGLAREVVVTDKELTIDGKVVGTPAYMSPEQAKGKAKQVDHRTDLWSLGVVLYQMAAGRKPFVGDNGYEIMAAILTEEPQPVTELAPNLPPRLAALINQLLSKEPGARPASAARVVAELEAIEKALTAAPPVVVVQLPAAVAAPVEENPFADMGATEKSAAPVVKSGKHTKPAPKSERRPKPDEDADDEKPRKKSRRDEDDERNADARPRGGWLKWVWVASLGFLGLVLVGGLSWLAVDKLFPSKDAAEKKDKEQPKGPPNPKKDAPADDRAAATALGKKAKLKLLLDNGPEALEVAASSALPEGKRLTITEIDFEDAKDINPLYTGNTFLPALSNLKSLTQVRMKRWQIELTEAQVALLAAMPLVNTLVRFDAQVELTPKSLAELKKFKALDDATFFAPDPSDALFTALAADLPRLKALTFLDMPAKAALTTKGWEAVAKMQRLAFFSMAACNTTGDAFRVFTTKGATSEPGAPGLLEFQGATGITDETLLDLSKRPTDVVALSLRNNVITDAGVMHLVAVESLRGLTLADSKVTEECVREFQAKRPDVLIKLNGKLFPAKKKP